MKFKCPTCKKAEVVIKEIKFFVKVYCPCCQKSGPVEPTGHKNYLKWVKNKQRG